MGCIIKYLQQIRKTSDLSNNVLSQTQETLLVKLRNLCEKAEE